MTGSTPSLRFLLHMPLVSGKKSDERRKGRTLTTCQDERAARQTDRHCEKKATKRRRDRQTHLGDSSSAEGDYSIAIEKRRKKKKKNCLFHASASESLFSKRDSAPTPKTALDCQWWIGRTRRSEQNKKKQPRNQAVVHQHD